MFALRQTWNDVFPPTKLYALDIKVNRIDPGWPITQKVSPAIHVNPNFFQAKVIFTLCYFFVDLIADYYLCNVFLLCITIISSRKMICKLNFK